jgi:hypothetical protein
MARRIAQRVGTVAGLLALAAVRLAGAQEPSRSLDDVLTHDIGLSAAELAAVKRGEVVGRVLPTRNGRDVAVVGVAQVNASRALLVERLRAGPGALGGTDRVPVHRFGTPAAVDDMQALAVTDQDLDRLRTCRVNACDFKIPATDMSRLRETIDLSSADARARVEAYARQRIVDLVTAYRRDGNAAMSVSDDHGHVLGSDAFAAMLRDSSPVFRMTPSLARYLADAPRDTLPGATNAIYWSMDDMPGARPTLRVMHEVVYAPPELPGTTIVAAKQIFADHYFEAGIEVLTVTDGPAAAPDQGVTVMAVRRYRFDNLPNGWPISIRARVVNGLRDQTLADLQHLQSGYARAGGDDRPPDDGDALSM